jgi:hypothetical protein
MTIPIERTRSLLIAENLLRELAVSNRAYARAEIRMLAKSALRHFPTLYDIERLAEAAPELLARPQECVD